MTGRRSIRFATPDDAAAMLEIYAPIVRRTAISFEFAPPTVDEFAERITRVSASNPWLVMEIDGAIAGYAYATEFRGRDAYAATRETTVYVHADFRRLGVGRLLMVELLDQLRNAGAHVAIGVVALPNEASVAFHETLGFHHAGTLRQVGRKFAEWHDEGFWVLQLGPDGQPE